MGNDPIWANFSAAPWLPDNQPVNMNVPQCNRYQSRRKIMKTRLLIVSMVLAMSANATAEEGVLEACLDAAKMDSLSDMTGSERELVDQSYTNAVDRCLQDHLTSYASSGEFSDAEDGLDPAERRFGQIDASRRSVGRRSLSIYHPDYRDPRQIGKYPRQRHRSTQHSRRVVMPKPRN